MAKFEYAPLYKLAKDRTRYVRIGEGLTRKVRRGKGWGVRVEPEALRLLARTAFGEVSFKFRTRHLENLASVLDDPAASDNDKFVAANLLKNAAVAAEGVLPLCQDTGTATIIAHKGELVETGADDARLLARGVFDAYTRLNLRASQMAPLSMLDEKNTGTNMPPQIDIYAEPGSAYDFLFFAKGGGSSNKTGLFQMNKMLLSDEKTLADFLREKIAAIGVAACPPYRLAVVVGGLSPEMCLKTVKLASVAALDGLPTEPTGLPQAYRDPAWEEKVMAMARETGLGAQYGGTAFALEARVIRLPRHGGSLPVGIGVSCNADRNIKGRITADGVFLEKLDADPARFLEKADKLKTGDVPRIDLDRPIEEVVADLSMHPVGAMLLLSGTLIVARDIAHMRLKKMLDAGEPLPAYFKDHPVYYAGPARTPAGKVTGSFGPTSAQRMDGYVEAFMKEGASRIMLAKGNRADKVVEACERYNGFYLGTIGGAAALIADRHILSSEVVDFEDLGMEAVRKITVRDLPVFIVYDNKGNRLF